MASSTIARVGAVLIALGMFGAVPAGAQDAVNERPFRVGVGIGPAVIFDGGRAQLLIAEEADYSFLTTDVGRPYVGLALAQQAGDFFLFNVGARVGFDFYVWSSEAVQILAGPSGILGASFGEGANGVTAFFHAQLAGEVRALFADGMVGVWLRPFAIDLFANDASFGRWNLLAGASVQF